MLTVSSISLLSSVFLSASDYPTTLVKIFCQRFSALRGCGLLALRFLKISKLSISTKVSKKALNPQSCKTLVARSLLFFVFN